MQTYHDIATILPLTDRALATARLRTRIVAARVGKGPRAPVHEVAAARAALLARVGARAGPA